jgi:PAS domain S-box-containing protein
MRERFFRRSLHRTTRHEAITEPPDRWYPVFNSRYDFEQDVQLAKLLPIRLSPGFKAKRGLNGRNRNTDDVHREGLVNREEEPQRDWAVLYRLAMLELDYDKLPHRIMEARNAIAIVSSFSAQLQPTELRPLQDALQNLRILEKELKGSSDVYTHIHSELAGEYVAMVNSSRRYVAATDGVCELLGYSRDELLTKTIDDVTAPVVRESVPETFRRYVDIGFMTGVRRLMHRDGSVISIRYEAKAFPMAASWRDGNLCDSPMTFIS